MAEEPGHKAMLFFLEVLMNSNGPLTISQLAGRFGSRSFTAEMRLAAGGNESGLKKFLLKYPSLFTVVGNMVSLFDSTKAITPSTDRDGSPGSTASTRSLPDVSVEMEAVEYFKDRMIKKEERWVQVRSLAGHLSQANAAIRDNVGPQLDFRKWLLRHPHIFEVQGELVGLREGVAAITATPILHRRSFHEFSNGFSSSDMHIPKVPPKTPPATRKLPPKTPPTVRRSHSFSEKRAQALMAQSGGEFSFNFNTPVVKRKNTPVTMTANEYKAVMFLKDIIEKRGGIKIHNITGHFSQAPEGVRNTIGWSKMELEEFLKKNAYIFYVSEDEIVKVVPNAKLNVIITGSRPQAAGSRTLAGRKGKIFHVAKLWGIIDLGKHEHVFFDRSIMKKPLEDLQREYKIGETLHFNAVMAPKTSRAKWRAIHVWKEHEIEPTGSDNDMSGEAQSLMSPAMSIEDEINEFLPHEDDDKMSDHMRDDSSMENMHLIIDSNKPSSIADFRFNSADYAPMAYEGQVQRREKEPDTATKIEKKIEPKIEATVNGNSSQEPKITKPTVQFQLGAPTGKTYADAGCQTVSTGDIIATQLYHDDESVHKVKK